MTLARSHLLPLVLRHPAWQALVAATATLCVAGLACSSSLSRCSRQ